MGSDGKAKRSKVPRDVPYLNAIKDGRLDRAVTIPDKKKQQAKQICRGKQVDD